MNGNSHNGRPALPEGWVWTTIGEVANIESGAGFPKTFQGKTEGDLPFAKVSDISTAVLTNDGSLASASNYVSFDEAKKLHAKVLPAETTVFAKIGEAVRLNRRAFVKRSLVVDNNVMGLIPNEDIVAGRFIYYFMQTVDLYEYSQATTVPSVRKSDVELIQFPLAPLPEQQRIVTEIEKHFTRLEAGIAALKRAQANLKRYKAAVLKAACEGKLVEQDPSDEPAAELLKRILAERRAKWEVDLRAKGKDPRKAKYEEPKPPDLDALPELPRGWCRVTWELILANEEGAFRRGPFGSTLTKSIFVDSGYKVYEQYCAINDDCSFGRYYITPEKFEEMKAFEVKAGDYLMSCSGVTLGRITRVPRQFERGIINQALLRIRLNESAIDQQYFLHLFRSPLFQKLLFDRSTGTAIPNVKGVKELKAIPIALPPLAEQRRIVAEVERRLSVVQELEGTLTANLARAERLRQAILKRAFEGKL